MNLKNIFDKKYEIIAFLILLILFIQLIYLIDYQSGVLDEQFYPGVGKYYFTNWDFSPFAFRYHPPLAYFINSIFLYHDNNTIWQQSPYDIGHIIEIYGLNNLLFITRLPIALVSILLGFFIFKWAKELYGKKAGLFALLLYSFEPTVLAHSAVATTDIVAVAFIFIAMYYLWRSCNDTNRFTVATAGLFLGLALLTKHSALFLIPITFAIITYKLLQRKDPNKWKIVIAYYLIAFLVVWASYSFQFSTVMNEVHSQEKSLEFVNSRYAGITKDIILSAMNTPIPATAYASSLGYSIWHSATGHDNYFFGTVSKEARWYYHPIAFLIKSPIPLLIIISIFLVGFVRKIKTIIWKDEMFIIIPIISYLIFLWFFVNLNIGLRHTLPIYPFLFVLLASITNFSFRRVKISHLWKFVIILILVWYVLEAILIIPHNISYFNQLVGSQNGWLYLSDTDVDWGQEVKGLANYMKEKNITSIYFAPYLPEIYTRNYIKNYTLPSCTQKNGLYAVGASHLKFFESRECYKWLLEHKPVDRIGYSMFVWNITSV